MTCSVAHTASAHEQAVPIVNTLHPHLRSLSLLAPGQLHRHPQQGTTPPAPLCRLGVQKCGNNLNHRFS